MAYELKTRNLCRRQPLAELFQASVCAQLHDDADVAIGCVNTHAEQLDHVLAGPNRHADIDLVLWSRKPDTQTTKTEYSTIRFQLNVPPAYFNNPRVAGSYELHTVQGQRFTAQASRTNAPPTPSRFPHHHRPSSKA